MRNLFAIALIGSGAACDWLPTDHVRVADTIEAALPLMTAAGVEELQLSEGHCVYVRDFRGEYLSGKLTPPCHDGDATGPDETAAGLATAVKAALGSTISRDFAAYLIYNDDGTLLRTRFMTGRCVEYRYEPLDTYPFGRGEVEDLGDDWWVVTAEDCSNLD